MAVNVNSLGDKILAKLDEMEKRNRQSGSEAGEAIGEGFDDGVEYSVRKIQASSIKLSNAFKNLRDNLNKQVQMLTSEVNGKKFNVKIDFSNININSEDIKQKISRVISSFKESNIIEFDAKGSEKQFENLISLYVKYEEKLKALQNNQKFSSNKEAIQNMKEQIVLASKMKEIFSFFDDRTDALVPQLMNKRELNTVISSATDSLERFNAVKEEVSKTKINVGEFGSIEKTLNSLKETIDGIKIALEPISDMFKNEGVAIQNMAENGTSSFKTLSEAVNALYNNLQNVERTVDAISKKKFDVTNITNISQNGNAQSAEKFALYQEKANTLLKTVERLNNAQTSFGNSNNAMWQKAINEFGGLYQFMSKIENFDIASLTGKVSGSTTMSAIKNVIGQLTLYKDTFLSVVNEINKVSPNTIDISFLSELEEADKKIEALEKVKVANEDVANSSKDMAKAMSTKDLPGSIDQLIKIADALNEIKNAIEPLSKAFTTDGTLFNKMATSGALSMDTLIEKLKEAVSLSAQLASGKAPVGVANTYTDIPKGEGQVGFNLDAAGELQNTKNSVTGLAEEKKEFKELGENAKAAAAGKNEFNEANQKVEQGAKNSIAGILGEAAAMEELEESAKNVWTTPREGGNVSGMNLPIQIVGENGQDAVHMFADVKKQLENEFNGPVQIKFQSNPNENGELEATRAAVSYINKELGVSISQIYDIKKNEDGVLVATQALENATIGATKEAKNFDAAMERAVARERIETFRKQCGSIEIDLTDVSKAAANITDRESLTKFNSELQIVREKLKQIKTDLKGENTLDTIASAEKKLLTLPTQIDTLRKKLEPLLKLDGADDISKKLDDIMVSYQRFMNTDDSDTKTKEFKNIINNLSVAKTLINNLKMDGSMSEFEDAAKRQVESYKKIVEYRQKLNSGNLGTEESKIVSERLKVEQKSFIQITNELKQYGNLYSAEDRLKVLSEARLKVLEKISESQAKSADREAKRSDRQASNYGKATYNSATKKYDNTLGSFENLDDGIVSKELLAAMDEYKKKYEDLTAVRQRFVNNPSLANDQSEKNAFNSTAKAVEAARKKVQLYIDDMQKLRQVEEDGLLKGDTKSYDPNGVLSQTDAIKQYATSLYEGKLQITGWNAAGNEMYGTLDKGKGVIENVTVALDRGTNTLYSYGKGTKEVGTAWQQLTAGIGRKAKEIATYVVGSSSIYKAIAEVRKGIQYVKEIDLALTELKKVTDETEDTYENFLKTASKTSAVIGSTVADFTNATADFARLGYTIEQATELAKAASVYKNVGDGIDSIAQATESIISTMKAFGIEADNSMAIVDKFNEVGK